MVGHYYENFESRNSHPSVTGSFILHNMKKINGVTPIEGFFEIWRLLGHYIDDGVLQIIEIEHDGVSNLVEPKEASCKERKYIDSTEKNSIIEFFFYLKND